MKVELEDPLDETFAPCHDDAMRSLLLLILVSFCPASARAAAHEYSCTQEKTIGPVSAAKAKPTPLEPQKNKAPDRFVYDGATGQATASDVRGQLAPALAIKLGGGVKFVTASAVTTINDAGEFHRVETMTTNGKLETIISMGRCTVKEYRLAGNER